MDPFAFCSDEVLWPALVLLLFSSTALCECPIPVLPPHSSIKGGGELANAYANGTVLQLQCIPGYENIPGTIPTMTCLDSNKWSDLLTLCQGECPIPVLPPHSSLKRGELADTYANGTVLQLQCIPGYENIPESIPTMTCLDSNKWSDLLTLCQGKECPAPNIDNSNTGTHDDNDIRLGGNITISCKRGFRLVGDAALKCVLKDDKVVWNREFPFCEHIPCKRPDNIPNGQFDPDPKDEYYVASVVIYRCKNDFSLIGNSNIICITTEDGQNGKWNLPAPECKVVKCDRPKVENGKLINLHQPSYTYNDGISFECNSGYSALGSLHIKCGANSSWVPAIPKCVKAVKCDQPKVENGKLVNLPKTSYTYNETITFECNSGYSAVGSLHIKCGANSSWVPAIPKCVKGTTEKPNTTSKDYAEHNKITALGKLIILLAVLYNCW